MTLNDYLILLLAIGIILALLISWVFYRTSGLTLLKIIILPLFLVYIYIGEYTFSKYIGAPIQGYPLEEFTYVHHIIPNSETIILWTLDDDRGNRLHIFPYEREIARSLQEAQERQNSGQRITGDFVETDNRMTLQVFESEDASLEFDERIKEQQ